MTNPQTDAPFQAGDLLCLAGPGVYHGRSVFYADSDAVRRLGFEENEQGSWRYGYSKWGLHPDGTTLRHATLTDITHLLAIEADNMARGRKTVDVLAEYLRHFKPGVSQ